jgi:hypothetical protein
VTQWVAESLTSVFTGVTQWVTRIMGHDSGPSGPRRAEILASAGGSSFARQVPSPTASCRCPSTVLAEILGRLGELVTPLVPPFKAEERVDRRLAVGPFCYAGGLPIGDFGCGQGIGDFG